ncbi:MAG: LLM class flavin-dependent oxidoreductase [Deltaproteobacteria bacterium]|nr:LLM class flavin-dependent oxidoreductase [Deltaproteobacteria bacterium]
MTVHFGIAPWALDESGSTAALEPLVAQAELADRLGFHSLWMPESHFQARGSNPAPLLLLAAMAARTGRIRLATTSYLLTIRHPLLVAEEVAVLDRLSGGRVILGVGRGFRAALFEAFDVPRASKRDRFEAALETMVQAWNGRSIRPHSAGEEPDPDPLRLSPEPVQQPHPPIWVAAFGPKALAQAGRLGLPYLASPIEPMSRLIENYARHREAAPDALPYEALPVPIMRTIFITRSDASAARVREGLRGQARAMASDRGFLRGVDFEEIDDWALVGSPAQVADGVEAYREKIGVTHMVARAQVPGATPEEVEASIHHLAELGERV